MAHLLHRAFCRLSVRSALSASAAAARLPAPLAVAAAAARGGRGSPHYSLLARAAPLLSTRRALPLTVNYNTIHSNSDSELRQAGQDAEEFEDIDLMVVTDMGEVEKIKKMKKDKKLKKKRKEAEDEESPAPKKIKKESVSFQGLTDLASDDEADIFTKITAENSDKLNVFTEVSEAEKEGDFAKFRIEERTIKKLKAAGVNYLFPVQSKTFDQIFDGDDVIVQARTGTGKTYSFGIPLVEKMHMKLSDKYGRAPMALVMAPTRELARQVHDNFQSLSDKIKLVCVYGGTGYEKQERAILSGVDVVVGTPGRILDFVQKGTLNMSSLQHVVLDEVDRMLDMGFTDSVEEIIRSAYNREDGEANPQTLMWSATVPSWVISTARKYMRKDYGRIDLIGQDRVKTSTTVQHLAISCSYFDRAATIGDILMVYSGNHGRAMVFCETKREADELAVSTAIKQETHVMHGDIPQEKREMVLKSFREGRYKCLITTDVAARGLDIPEVDLVIQCSPPKDVDSYIHRSGRTGRAGRLGTCVCFYKANQSYALMEVERYAGMKFKKIGAPTTEDIIKASAVDAAKALEAIPAETLERFRESAQRLVDEKGGVDALAAALAVISGNTDIKTRSLLSASIGYTTYLFKTNVEIERMGYVWRSLERRLPEDVKEQVKGMRLCKDKMGAVFDLPTELDATVEDRWTDGKFDSLEKATELPELEENNFSSGGGGGGRGGWNSRGGGGGKYNNSNGYNSRGRDSGYGGRGGSKSWGNSGNNSWNSNGNSSMQNTKITFD